MKRLGHLSLPVFVLASLFLLPSTGTWAQTANQLKVRDTTVGAGATGVVIPIDLLTQDQPLTSLSFDVLFDPAMCAALVNPAGIILRKAGRTTTDPLAQTITCTAGEIRIRLLDLVNASVVIPLPAPGTTDFRILEIVLGNIKPTASGAFVLTPSPPCLTEGVPCTQRAATIQARNNLTVVTVTGVPGTLTIQATTTTTTSTSSTTITTSTSTSSSTSTTHSTSTSTSTSRTTSSSTSTTHSTSSSTSTSTSSTTTSSTSTTHSTSTSTSTSTSSSTSTTQPGTTSTSTTTPTSTSSSTSTTHSTTTSTSTSSSTSTTHSTTTSTSSSSSTSTTRSTTTSTSTSASASSSTSTTHSTTTSTATIFSTTTSTFTSTTTLPACGPVPQTGCVPAAAGGARLLMGNRRLGWEWRSRATVNAADFGSPTTETSYLLCVYDGTGLRLAAKVPAAGTCRTSPCWRQIGTAGFVFHNRDGIPEGMKTLVLRSGAFGRGHLLARAAGSHLQVPSLPLTTPVRVQIQQSSSPACWDAAYSVATINTAARFRARSD